MYTIKEKGLSYLLDEKRETAAIVGYDSPDVDIIIPRSIKYHSNDYLVTYIEKNSFYFANIRNVEFEHDSELQIIGEKAFSNSSLEKISIPSTVTRISSLAFNFCQQLQSVFIPENSKLKSFEKLTFFASGLKELAIPSNVVCISDESFNGATKLINVKVSPNNILYTNYKDKFVIGKTNKNDIIYENLIFAPRNVVNVDIPPFIKQISPFCFEMCRKLKKVNFLNDSELRIIKNYAFSNSSLVKFAIPKSVIQIGSHSFSYCCSLKKISVDDESDLQIIDKYAFANSAITSFSITSKVTNIEYSAFSNCNNLRIVEIHVNNLEFRAINKDAFLYLKNTSILVPANFKVSIK